MQEIVLASGNPGKLRELDNLLEPLGWQVRSRKAFDVPEPEETGLTFVENALIKARNAAQSTGLAALADDSGLAVDALGGRPGIYSARYSGPEGDDEANNRKLVAELGDLPPEQRGAFYHCSLVLLTHAEDPCPIIAEGQWRGRIGLEPRGEGGFGYDPLFELPERGCTSAELDPEEKDAISHRGKAMRRLREEIRERW
ncbi:RdgB/HAM1 family non-canonical purine NTP pyrophosphatase [Thiohalorhabdus sp.]|uniref:RdgB/HAM1 family non-canonical purine NTP pyrophosphatase n=1 Tax=Thiohalorhabdus sp. TaxID=3094134 RepID=UPI002FC313BD